jgi:acetyl esterase/lipase
MVTVRAVGPARHKYGTLRWQVGDLWLPDELPAGGCPVVVLIHGGYWRSVYTKALMSPLARAVNARGWAAWNIEYRRVGPVGGGGGWPSTLDDVAAALDHVQRLPSVDPDRVVTCGHSAGGHLAFWAAARHHLPNSGLVSPTAVQPRAAVALAGVVDLVRGAALGLGSGAIPQFLDGFPDEFPERYRAASPAALLPLGVPQVLVHGLADTVVPPEMSEEYQRAATAAGDDASYEPLAGLDHRDVIRPARAAWPVIAAHLERHLSP